MVSITKKGNEDANNESGDRNQQQEAVAPENTIQNRRVRAVIDFMNANIHRRIPMTELAEVVNLSTSHLSRLFKSETGVPPGEYLSRLRMEKARHLLATSFLSIKQIMATVGYNSKGHFVRHFRKAFGLAPSKYRKGVNS
jgi:transcriptional regulator GlxA family with amidase domain